MTNSKVEFNTLGGPLRRRSTFSPTHLSTQVAEFTFAQIVDGLPTRHTDQFRILQYSPKIHEREGPNSLARNVVAEWRSKFQAENLVVDPDVSFLLYITVWKYQLIKILKVAEAYQNTAVGTREFHLRLIEIAAIALHTIASDLFSHTNKPSYKRPQSPRLEFPPGEFIMRPGEKRDIPTYLYPQNYIDHDRYPMGVADMVGYWAEYPVLGDVVLFDRGQSEKEVYSLFPRPISCAHAKSYIVSGCVFPSKGRFPSLQIIRNAG